MVGLADSHLLVVSSRGTESIVVSLLPMHQSYYIRAPSLDLT